MASLRAPKFSHFTQSFKRPGNEPSLAIRTDSKKLQPMRNAFKPGCAGNALFNLRRKTIGHFNNFRAGTAHKVVVMIVVVRNEFETRRAIAKIETMDHAHFFQQMHRPINGHEIAFTRRKRSQNLFAVNRVFLLAQDVEDRLARPGDFARFSPKLVSEGGEIVAALMVRMRALFHTGLQARTRENPSEMMNSAMQLRTMAGPHGTSSL